MTYLFSFSFDKGTYPSIFFCQMRFENTDIKTKFKKAFCLLFLLTFLYETNNGKNLYVKNRPGVRNRIIEMLFDSLQINYISGADRKRLVFVTLLRQHAGLEAKLGRVE